MTNPITNDVFDSRDLIDYIDELKTTLVDGWNEFIEIDRPNDFEEYLADDYDDLFGTAGFEYANDVSDAFETFEDENSLDIEEVQDLISFSEELSGADDFTYGSTIIHESYFTEYCEELLKDFGYIKRDHPSWIEIDFEATAENMSDDYLIASYKGDDYYIR